LIDSLTVDELKYFLARYGSMLSNNHRSIDPNKNLGLLPVDVRARMMRIVGEGYDALDQLTAIENSLFSGVPEPLPQVRFAYRPAKEPSFWETILDRLLRSEKIQDAIATVIRKYGEPILKAISSALSEEKKEGKT